MKYSKAFKLFYKNCEKFRNLKFHRSMKIFSFTSIFLFYIVTISPGEELISKLDFSGNGPLFLSKIQMQADILQAERLLRENYVRYPILNKAGIQWESAFQRLADYL